MEPLPPHTNTYDLVGIMAQELLPTDPDERKSAPNLYDEAIARYAGLADLVPKTTFVQYVASLSQENDSSIAKEVGQNGYFIRSIVVEESIEPEVTSEVVEPNSEIPVADSEPRRRQTERILYSHFETWLRSNGYNAAITADMKTLGAWGNPDVVGIRSDRGLSGRTHEVATVEAKISHRNFKRDIFEAVSHRRFADRAYFAFAAPISFLTQQHDELRYYSELYKVGVLVAALPSADFEKYQSGNLTELESVDIFEFFSSPLDPKLPRWQFELFQALGISDDADVTGWGEQPFDSANQNS